MDPLSDALNPGLEKQFEQQKILRQAEQDIRQMTHDELIIFSISLFQQYHAYRNVAEALAKQQCLGIVESFLEF